MIVAGLVLWMLAGIIVAQLFRINPRDDRP
jgi:hypothetical protein